MCVYVCVCVRLADALLYLGLVSSCEEDWCCCLKHALEQVDCLLDVCSADRVCLSLPLPPPVSICLRLSACASCLMPRVNARLLACDEEERLLPIT